MAKSDIECLRRIFSLKSEDRIINVAIKLTCVTAAEDETDEDFRSILFG